MQQLGNVIDRAKHLLVITTERGVNDVSLWEHSTRVMRLAQLICQAPESQDLADPDATLIAALFHDAGWVLQSRAGSIYHWQVLVRPTNDMQRDLAANYILDNLSGMAARETLAVAAEAIRQSGNRFTRMPEAAAVSDAVNLNEIGLPYLLRQFRLQQSEGRGLGFLLSNWRRQQEYKFWDARINDCLRLETSRTIARQRLAAVQQFMEALASEVDATDLRGALERQGARLNFLAPDVTA